MSPEMTREDPLSTFLIDDRLSDIGAEMALVSLVIGHASLIRRCSCGLLVFARAASSAGRSARSISHRTWDVISAAIEGDVYVDRADKIQSMPISIATSENALQQHGFKVRQPSHGPQVDVSNCSEIPRSAAAAAC